MKIHVTLMSIYQNSDMYLHTKKFIAHKINPFNYEDLNIFLQYYFLQLYYLIFYNFSIYNSTLQYFYLFFYFFFAKKIICTSHTHTLSLSLTHSLTHNLLIITHTHVQHDHHYITHIYTLYILTHSGEDKEGEDADVRRVQTTVSRLAG
jgi:hypothetical protein